MGIFENQVCTDGKMNTIPLFASEPHTQRLGYAGNLDPKGLALKYQADGEPGQV